MGVWIETYLKATANNVNLVTPCMGVWIETHKEGRTLYDIKSHPVWVCGLKQSNDIKLTWCVFVTPCMGVWIET